LRGNPTEAQQTPCRDTKKTDNKALLYIRQCLDAGNSEKVANAYTSKVAWDVLVKNYVGGTKVKLQYYGAGTILGLMTITNQMKNCEETVSDQMGVEKVLRIGSNIRN